MLIYYLVFYCVRCLGALVRQWIAVCKKHFRPLSRCKYYILVMQRFRVVYREISHESLVFSGMRMSLLPRRRVGYSTAIPRERVAYFLFYSMPQKIHWPDGKDGCDTIELHWSMGSFGAILMNIQQLSCILIGCIFYGMV